MTYKADYTIDLPNGKISLLFNSWTFREHCLKIGIELEDLYKAIEEGRAFRSKDLPTLLLTASESYCLFNSIPFAYNEKDAFVWIDELGGFNSGKLISVYKVFVAKLLNI